MLRAFFRFFDCCFFLFFSFSCLRWFFRRGSLFFSLYSFFIVFFSIALFFFSFLFLSSMLYITSLFFFPFPKKVSSIALLPSYFLAPPHLPSSRLANKNACYIIPNEHCAKPSSLFPIPPSCQPEPANQNIQGSWETTTTFTYEKSGHH